MSEGTDSSEKPGPILIGRDLYQELGVQSDQPPFLEAMGERKRFTQAVSLALRVGEGDSSIGPRTHKYPKPGRVIMDGLGNPAGIALQVWRANEFASAESLGSKASKQTGWEDFERAMGVTYDLAAGSEGKISVIQGQVDRLSGWLGDARDKDFTILYVGGRFVGIGFDSSQSLWDFDPGNKSLNEDTVIDFLKRSSQLPADKVVLKTFDDQIEAEAVINGVLVLDQRSQLKNPTDRYKLLSPQMIRNNYQTNPHPDKNQVMADIATKQEVDRIFSSLRV